MQKNNFDFSFFQTTALMAVVFCALPESVFAAAKDLKQSVDQVTEGMEYMPIVLSGIAYLASGATILQGAGLLKKHADNPQSVPLAAGMTRIIAGAFIAALPFAISWLINTLDLEGDYNSVYIDFTKNLNGGKMMPAPP